MSVRILPTEKRARKPALFILAIRLGPVALALAFGGGR
jgi:hypothetical protein